MNSTKTTHAFAGTTVRILLALLVLSLAAGVASAQGHNFDARIANNADRAAAGISAAQSAAERALDREVPGLSVSYDPLTGAARNVRAQVGYLSDVHPGGRARDVALEFVGKHRKLFGLTTADLSDLEFVEEVISEANGVSHLYFTQTYRGLPVYLGQLHANVDRDGRMLSVNNSFLPDLASAANSELPRLGAAAAVAAAGESIRAKRPAATAEPVLMWLPIRGRKARLVWNFQLETRDQQHLYDFTVDARSGKVWTRTDWTNSDSYRVYEQPVESPIHTSPAPPVDARTLAINPEDGFASQDGWFHAGTSIMDGNNVHACLDRDGGGCDAGEPSCSGSPLVCDFALDLSSSPTSGTNGAAAVTNLFYWNNRIHDVQYQYGFDEAAGNFQEDNFGRGGAGSDSVDAEAQDGGGNCNANFSTPTDGGNPRMQMYLCTNASPSLDGDLDAGVIVHEYGHGISNRQVGGPSTSSCLGNSQQAGEGWSDWLGLVYTAETGDQGTDVRGLGAYLFALGPEGTIRDLPYSTDPAVNDWTYESISGAGIPHGVGSRWAQAAWEVYWALVDQHGFEQDLINFDPSDPNEAGNKRALFYINEGLKNTACSPTFVDNRDGILQAATSSFGGEDVCLLWDAFAAFGLGIDAVSGGSNSTNPTNGFNVPVECGGTSCLPKGSSCTADSQCCSNKCKGKPGSQSCK